jgi:hypothetical protein
MSKNGRRRGVGSRLGRAFKSFAGFMTAVAAIATATATILGLMVSHQSTQLAQIRVTVSQQAQQIHRMKAATLPAPSPTATGNASQGGQGGHVLASGGRFLSDLAPTVDNAYSSTGQQVIVAKSYPDTVSFDCNGPSGDQPDEAYDVAGSTSFTAVVGIPDNTQYVTDVIATVTFSNEADQRIGKPVQVSLGHPARVTLDTAGVTQLGVTCTGHNAGTGQSASGFQVALGNAHVS